MPKKYTKRQVIYAYILLGMIITFTVTTGVAGLIFGILFAAFLFHIETKDEKEADDRRRK